MESVGNTTIQNLDVSSSSISSTSGYYSSVFDGTPQDTTGYDSVHIICNSTKEGLIRVMHSIDNSVWDLTDTENYPGSDVSVGGSKFVQKPIKAKWIKTQFVNLDLDFSADIRFQTMLHEDIPVTNNITAEVSVNVPDLAVKPINKVWQSDDVSSIVTVESSGLRINTVHCMNFAPDYRFIKLYDISGDVSLSTHKPKITVPVVADTPQHLNFNNGLIFTNALQVGVTRGIKSTDNNVSMEGDVHCMVTYTTS